MGILDKIKNLFYEDEVIEVPKENLKNDVVGVKEAEPEQKKDDMDEVVSERDLLKSETTFKFPVIFEDEDFADMEQEKPKPKVQPVQNTYRSESTTKYKKPTLDREVIREVIEKPKKFKPSPVISPVYGIMDKKADDKNGTSSKSSSLEHTKEMVINFDTIRQKAYGTLTDDLESALTSNSKEIDDIEKEIDSILQDNNLLTDLEEKEEVVNNVDVSTEEENEEYNYSDFGVEYKIDDSKIETAPEEQVNDTEQQEEAVKEKDKEVELTEDLFNLIDSMYDR